MKKEEMKISDGGEWSRQHIKVVVFPEDKPDYVPEYDCILLSMESVHDHQKGMLRSVYMTPDEALDVANKLTTAVQAWFQYGYEPYDSDFNQPRKKVSPSKDETTE